ncbi:MAG: hypothetical protein HY332_16370 [Chloroflexi bacterium]|nr:hypothetical protein [Chloroflexota bacterium]
MATNCSRQGRDLQPQAGAPEVVGRLAQCPAGWFRGRVDRMARDDDMD